MFLNTFYPWPPFPYFLKVDFFIAIRQKKCLFNFSLTKCEGNNNQRDSNRLFCNWNKEPDKEQRCTQGGMGGGIQTPSLFKNSIIKTCQKTLKKLAKKAVPRTSESLKCCALAANPFVRTIALHANSQYIYNKYTCY